MYIETYAYPPNLNLKLYSFKPGLISNLKKFGIWTFLMLLSTQGILGATNSLILWNHVEGDELAFESFGTYAILCLPL